MTAVTYRKIRIFVASPGDVLSERDQLNKVVEELNLTMSAIAPEKGLILELVRWETHVHPGLGLDAQAVVFEQIPDFDIFVGLLWKRMGTPTSTASSGTEAEFRLAYETWQKNKTLPVLFYFCQQAFPPPRTLDEVEQLRRVVAFRAELSNKGLVADYAEHERFADVIRPHLLLVLGKLCSPHGSAVETANRVAARASESGNLAVRQQLAGLAQEYEMLRETMDPGDTRTRRMEVLVTRMRALGLAGYPMLPELALSASPGQRLAGVTILQLVPNPDYINWLAERLRLETPFLGYHAAVALLAAVRTLRASHEHELRVAIAQAKKSLEETTRGNGWRYSDRYSVLDEAEQELEHSVPNSTLSGCLSI